MFRTGSEGAKSGDIVMENGRTGICVDSYGTMVWRKADEDDSWFMSRVAYVIDIMEIINSRSQDGSIHPKRNHA